MPVLFPLDDQTLHHLLNDSDTAFEAFIASQIGA